VHRGDEVVYSNLDDDDAGPTTDVEYYSPGVGLIGIEVPEAMYQGVMLDQRTRTGNLVIEHPTTFGGVLESVLRCGRAARAARVPECEARRPLSRLDPAAESYHEIDAEALDSSCGRLLGR